MIPEQLGPYLIGDSLGRGGMGTVYLGRHETTGDEVAIKVLAPVLSGDPGFRERFGTEIETLKKLAHPNIVELYGYGEQEGTVYYVMEVVRGRTLQDELRQGRVFGWQEVVGIAIQVCLALKHAHDRGIVHRDLKPANLLLTPDDQIKLSDFGIAKLYGATQMTGHGGVLGTADYMAPEQADGRPVTARTDLYSLGSVMFALLTRKPPFSAKSVGEVIHSLKYKPAPSVRVFAQDCPRELDQLILQLLEKDPDKRVPTAHALANRLRSLEHAFHEQQLGGMDPPTDVMDEDQQFLPTARGRFDGATNAISHEDATVVSDESDSHLADSDEFLLAQEPPPATSHYTHVTKRAREKADLIGDTDDDTWASLAKVAALVLSLGGILGFLVWGLLPPGADRVFARIEAAAETGDAQDLVAAARDLEQFATRFPDDPRQERVKQLRQELETYRLQKRIESQARRGLTLTEQSPCEQLYLEAIRELDRDPVMAAAKLQAILQVFSGIPDSSPDTLKILRLARDRLTQLKVEARAAQSSMQPFLSQQLQRVEQLRGQDPVAAQQLLRSLQTLFEDAPWADPLFDPYQEDAGAEKPKS